MIFEWWFGKLMVSAWNFVETGFKELLLEILPIEIGINLRGGGGGGETIDCFYNFLGKSFNTNIQIREWNG